MNPLLSLPALLACLMQVGNDASWKERFDLAPENWQEGKACGPNCLFVFLRAFGREVDHKELVKVLPATDKGVSLAVLQETATSYGVRTETVRATSEALPSLSLPAILQLADGDEEHFVVLCEFNQNQALVVDGGSGRLTNMQPSSLMRAWSGYALVAVEPRWVTWSRLGVYVGAAVLAVLLLRQWFFAHPRSRKNRVAGVESSLSGHS